MGFFDFLFGGGFGNRDYENLVIWAERRVGRVHQGMTDAEIDSYISSMSSIGKSFSDHNLLSSFKKYLKSKYGTR